MLLQLHPVAALPHAARQVFCPDNQLTFRVFAAAHRRALLVFLDGGGPLGIQVQRPAEAVVRARVLGRGQRLRLLQVRQGGSLGARMQVAIADFGVQLGVVGVKFLGFEVVRQGGEVTWRVGAVGLIAGFQGALRVLQPVLVFLELLFGKRHILRHCAVATRQPQRHR
jgi:hypothetical protein